MHRSLTPWVSGIFLAACGGSPTSGATTSDATRGSALEPAAELRSLTATEADAFCRELLAREGGEAKELACPSGGNVRNETFAECITSIAAIAKTSCVATVGEALACADAEAKAADPCTTTCAATESASCNVARP